MDILQRKPNARVTEVVKEIAQCWQALSKEDRMPYKEKARKGKSLKLFSIINQLEISFNIHLCQFLNYINLIELNFGFLRLFKIQT